jgi:hypothetical protein
MTMRHSTIIKLFTILIISLLFFTGALCQNGQGAQPTPTPTATIVPTSTPSVAEPTPTATATATAEATMTVIATLGPEGCVYDRDAIQAAIYAYNRSHGEWPTADGKPGDIAWGKLVKEYLPYMPHTNDECNWQVNSHPEGEVCVPPEKMC